MTTLEQTIENIRTWPPAVRRQLREQLQTLEQQEAASTPLVQQPVNGARPDEAANLPPVTPSARGAHPGETLEEQLARFRKAQGWIREHRAEYLGQWVVLVGDQLISHGFDSRQVGAAAKAAGIEVPFITLVREEPKAFMSGLL